MLATISAAVVLDDVLARLVAPAGTLSNRVAAAAVWGAAIFVNWAFVPPVAERAGRRYLGALAAALLGGTLIFWVDGLLQSP